MFAAFLKFLSFGILVPVSLIFPKNKKLWVFGAWFGKSYSDNTRFLFEAAHRYPEITPVWISKNKKIVDQLVRQGKMALYAYSFKGVFCCLRAGVAFYTCGPTDINEYAVFRSIKVQLWHGIPLKRILYDDQLRYPASLWGKSKSLLDRALRFIVPARRQSWDYVLSSSPLVSERLCSAFNVRREKVLELGYPRHDRMLESAASYTKENNKKTILYAPTHRGEGRSSFTAKDYFSGVDFSELEHFLQKGGFKLLVKLHPFHAGDNSLQNEVEQCSSIEVLPSSSDIYDVIGQVDVLITDYSSIYIDFLVYNRPIIFYCFDLENYLNVDRGMYDDYSSTTPGIKCHSWGCVIEQLQQLSDGYDACAFERKSQMSVYFSHHDIGSCDRIIGFLTR